MRTISLGTALATGGAIATGSTHSGTAVFAIAAGSTFALGGLRRIGTQKLIFEGSAIEAADNSLHLFLIGSFDKGETFRFLGLGIADYLDGISNESFGIQP